jgi:hypothetical protein
MSRQFPVYGGDPKGEEPIPGPMSHGPYDDLGLEARRLSRFVRAQQDRAAISARRSQGWRPADEALADAEEDWLDRNPSGADFRSYLASAEQYRRRAEAARRMQG